MIYSDKFVWLHFPKCAGTKVSSLFYKYFNSNTEIHQDPVGIKNDPHICWHHSIKQRERVDQNFFLKNQAVICSFRRLPSWLESRYDFEFYRSPNLQHDPQRLMKGFFLTANGKEKHADDLIKNFLPDSLIQSKNLKFIRMEFFEEDFKKIFSKYIDVSIIPDEEFSKRINTSKKSLSAKYRENLYSSGDIYNECPLWSRVEYLAYSDNFV